MKTLISLTVLLFLFSIPYAQAQNLVFHENFESPSGADSVTSNPSNYWGISSLYYASGAQSDSAQVKPQDTVYLTTQAFSTVGMQYVILEFDQICKIEFFDGAYIEVSTNNGSSWTQLTSPQYLGSAQFATGGNKFNSTSYPDWMPANNNAVPTNAWWKHETFDISSMAANQSQVMVRFKLMDINNTGSAGNYGWLIDNISITTALDELIPPSITMDPSNPSDSVFFSGPFTITASITDNSGIDSALLIYSTNGGQNDTVNMTFNYGTVYSGTIDTIPAFSIGDTICYHVWAMDSSLSHNTSKAPQMACEEFIIFQSQPYPNCTTTISSFPYFENFDQNFTPGSGTPTNPGTFASGWERTPNTSSVFTWLVYTGSTSTSNTGPIGDNTSGNGNYIYTESSYGASNSVTTLLTPCIDLTQINVPVLEFYYHMFGSSQGELHVDIWYGNSWQPDIITPITGNQGNSWQKVSVNLGAYKGAATKIRFRAIKGSSIYSDIAIDDVKIWEPPAYDAGMVSIDRPQSPANTGLQPVKATFANYGSAVMNKVTINWQINGQSKTPFVWTGILTPGSRADSITIGNHNFASGPSNIKIWTSLPNDSADGFAFNDTVQTSVIACTAPLRGTFTLGGVSADFPDFDQALYALENCGIDSSIVFLVNPGTYTEQLDMDTIPGASITNTVKFTSATGDSTSVILDFSPSSSQAPFIVRFRGTSHITFSNMTVSSSNSSYGRLFVFENNASYNTIENCRLIMPYGSFSYTSAGYCTSSNSEYNSFINNDVQNGYYAFYWRGMSTTIKAKGNRFIGNTVKNFRYYGLYITYQDSFIVSGNHFLNDSNSTSVYPVYAYYADGAYRIEKNNIVARGTSSVYGIRVYYGTSQQNDPGFLSNNMVSLTGSSTYPYGLYLYNCNNLNIYHNTIVLEVDSAPNGRVLYSSSGSNIRMKNNIFSNNSLGYAYYISSTAAIIESDYNNIYANSQNFAYYSGIKNNLSALQSASNKESNSLSLLPNFYSKTDLHLTYSPLSSSGTPIPEVPDDIDGEIRSVSSPSMGADELAPIPIDAGVLDVIKPDASEAEADMIVPKIVIKNFGTDTLYGFDVRMKLNGVHMDTITYSQTLYPFDVDTVTFDTIQVPPGHNDICFTSVLATDTNHYNDELCKYFYGIPIVDMGVVRIMTPDSGMCLTASEDLVVQIKNYGSQLINFSQKPVTIYTQVTAPISINIPDKIINSGGLQPGATMQVTLSNTLDMNHTGEYIFDVWSSVVSDGDETNDSILTKKLDIFATIVSYPYSQDFENFVPTSNAYDPGQLKEGWVQNNPSENYVWFVGQGATNNSNTGPAVDHSLGTASGKFIYAESTGYSASSANLVSPCIDLGNMTSPTLRFWYHMYGSKIHSLRVDVHSNGQWHYSLGHLIGSLHTSETDDWKQAFVDLSSFAGETIKLRFRAIKTVGYEADLAIDDISIFEPKQRDAGVSNTFIQPAINFSAEGTVIPIEIKIENYGLDTLKDLYVGYVAGPNAPIIEHWTGVIPPYSSQAYEFNTKYAVPAGGVNICAFTSYNGDMNSANDTSCLAYTGVSILSVPYTDDFEGTNFFVSTGGLKQWERGYPNKSTFTAPHSGNNAWVTSLNDYYMNNSDDYLYTPFFDLSSFPGTKLRFWHRLQSQAGYDGGFVDISTDGGSTFSSLGYISDPLSTHWYNTNLGGSHSWSGADSGWVHSTYDLSNISTSTPIQLRFKFYSDNSNNMYDGWMIDDFAITPDPISEDAGVEEVVSPVGYTASGSSVNVEIKITNYGTGTLTQIPVNYQVDNGNVVTQNWMGTLAPGASTNFTFTSSFTATASYDLKTWTSLSNDSHWFNDSAIVSMRKDMEMVAIIRPQASEVFDDSLTIIVQFRNNGSDTLTTCDFSYNVNGGTYTVETWTGTLAPEGIAFYTFNTKWKVPFGINNFCAKAALTGDTDASNDKLCKYVSGNVGIVETGEEKMQILSNEPNPFSHQSIVNIYMPKRSRVQVRISDLSGRVLRTATHQLQAGENQLIIERGSLSPGVYFYELIQDKQRSTIRIMVND
jgi:hypothetical protein